MKKESNILFGIDASDFSIQALLVVGDLLKTIEKPNLTIFHGTAGFDFDLLSRLANQDPLVAKKNKELWNLETRKVLERGKCHDSD